MIQNYYFKRLLFLVFISLVYSSCNTDANQKLVEIKSIKPLQSKKVKKDFNKKKGIEIMADFVADIMKPIGAEKSSYKDGFMMTEHQKAMKRRGSFTTKNVNTIEFKERGPVNVPGRVRKVVVAPDNSDKWYAGSVGGGLWVTEDAGATWKNLTDYKIPNLSTSTVAISNKNPKVIYLGTGEPFGNLDAIGGIGILKSINGGETWEYLENTSEFGGIGRLAVDPENENDLVVAASNGIYVTRDGGLTWQNTYTGGNVQDLVLAPGCSVLFGGVRDIGVIKSVNGGNTWTLVLDKEDYNTNHVRFEVDVSPVNANKVFVGVYSSSNATTAVNTDFYVSDDAGKTFTLLGYEGDPASGNLITGQGWYDNLLMAHPFDENIFYAGGVVTHKVEIAGDPLSFTFQPIAAGYNNELNDYVHVDQHGLTFALSKNQTSTRTVEDKKFKLILSNDGGVYHTDYLEDPGTTFNDWSQAAVGLNNTQFYGADKQNGVQDYTAGAQDNGSWISFTGAEATAETEYTRILGGDGFEVIWNYNDPNKYLCGSQYNNFARYVNGEGFRAPHGETGAGTSPFYSKITNSNNNPDVVFSPSVSGVWRSINFAETWSLTAIPNYAARNLSALDVSVSTANPNIVWTGNAMTESGAFVMHVSRDNGVSYEATNGYEDPRTDASHNYLISGIETSPTNPNRAYTLFSGQGAAKVLKTEDLGQTWEDISGFSTGEDRGFPDVAIHSLIEMPYNENVLWVGTDIGVFQTVDGGQNWALIVGLPAFSVWEMKIVNNEVVMATHGRGVWTAELNQLEGYEPPAYYAPPTIISVFQESIQSPAAIVRYVQPNEEAETVIVYVDDQEVEQITDNVEQGAEYTYVTSSLSEGEHTIGFKVLDEQGNSSIISILEFDIIDFNAPKALVSIDTFETDDVYTFGGEFVIDNVGGAVTSNVLNNSEHPYENGVSYNTVLKHTVSVTEGKEIFTYEDVAIVQPGPETGRFYDAVVIEGSKDLQNWTLLNVYDARKFPEWLEAYTAATPINDDLFKEQSINLLGFFSAGDEIAIRFRLLTGSTVNSFGWAIKSINPGQEEEVEEEEVEEEDVAVVEEVTPLNTNRALIYPTAPVDGNFKISSPERLENARVEIYSLSGKLVYAKSIEVLDQTEQSFPIYQLESGMYITVITDGVTKEKGRIVIR